MQHFHSSPSPSSPSSSTSSSFTCSSEETLLLTQHIPHLNPLRIRNVAERRTLSISTPPTLPSTFSHRNSSSLHSSSLHSSSLLSSDLPDIEACADPKNVVLGSHLRTHSSDSFTPLYPQLGSHPTPEQQQVKNTEELLTSLYLRKRRLTDHSLAKRLCDVLSLPSVSSSFKNSKEEGDEEIQKNRSEASSTVPGGNKKSKPKKQCSQNACQQQLSEGASHPCTHIVNAQMSSFPRSAMVSSLVELDLSSNRLTVLPDTLAFLAPTLRYLNLSGNIFTSFPSVLKKLNRLQCLVLSRNRLVGALPKDLPPSLPDLRVLRLCNNFITSLPDTLSSLSRLRTLVLGSVFGGNRLTDFPAHCLSRMHHLRELDISHNSIRNLPDDIGHPRSRLIRLSAADNRLTRIPREIGRCAHLTSLNLARNLLTSLPCEIVDLVQLETLDLSENLLCILPGDIAEFMRKTTLLLAGNPFTRDPGCSSPMATSPTGNATTNVTEESATENSSSLSSHRPDVLGLGLDRSGALSRLLLLAKLDVETTVEYDHDDGGYSPNADDEELEERDAREDLEYFLARHGRNPEHATSKERYYAPIGAGSPISSPYSSNEIILSNPVDSNSTDDRNVSSSWIPSVNAFGYRPRSSADTTNWVASEVVHASPIKTFSPSLFPSLRELAARTVLAASIPVQADLLPPAVHMYLETGARPCSLCRRPYVKEWVSCVQMGGFRGHPCVPRRVRYCSARCWETATVAIKEKERESEILVSTSEPFFCSSSGTFLSPEDPNHHHHNHHNQHPYPLVSPAVSPKLSRAVLTSPSPQDPPPFTPCAECPRNSHCPIIATPARWRLRFTTNEDSSGSS